MTILFKIILTFTQEMKQVHCNDTPIVSIKYNIINLIKIQQLPSGNYTFQRIWIKELDFVRKLIKMSKLTLMLFFPFSYTPKQYFFGNLNFQIDFLLIFSDPRKISPISGCDHKKI